MIELLIALFLKFWMFLFGMIRGALSAVPFLRRWLLTSCLETELSGRHLVLHAEKRDLLLTQARIFAIENARIALVMHEDIVLMAGETRQIELPADVHACVLLTEMLDLNSGRRAHVHRRLQPDQKQSGAQDL